MADESSLKNLRERLTAGTEDKLGRALTDLLENPLLTGAIGRAFDAREKAAQAQEVAMGALNLPSAADIERLTRRLRSVSQRLEGIEDGVQRLDDTLKSPPVEERLTRIEEQLRKLADTLSPTPKPKVAVKRTATASRATAKRAPAKRAAPKRTAAAKSAPAAKRAAPKKSV